MEPSLPGGQVVSVHRFTRPGIRLWLPLVMLSVLALCGWLVAPHIGIFELVALLLLAYVTVSALVSVCEIIVVEDGLIVNRLLLPERFIPWEAIDRVIVFAHAPDGMDTHFEVASIGVYEGLSPLNRLPGLLYGQGFRQTIIVTPDAVEGYDTLMTALEANTRVVWH